MKKEYKNLNLELINDIKFPLEQKIINRLFNMEELFVEIIYGEMIRSKNVKMSLEDLKIEIGVILNEYTTNVFYNIKKHLINSD